jgi:hypothetical protein
MFLSAEYSEDDLRALPNSTYQVAPSVSRARTLAQDILHLRGYVSYVRQCQKGALRTFGTFGTPSVSSFGELRDLLWERRDECLGAGPVLVCHDEVVVECDVQ